MGLGPRHAAIPIVRFLKRLVIPRHNEIDEYTAAAIVRQARDWLNRSLR